MCPMMCDSLPECMLPHPAKKALDGRRRVVASGPVQKNTPGFRSVSAQVTRCHWLLMSVTPTCTCALPLPEIPPTSPGKPWYLSQASVRTRASSADTCRGNPHARAYCLPRWGRSTACETPNDQRMCERQTEWTCRAGCLYVMPCLLPLQLCRTHVMMATSRPNTSQTNLRDARKSQTTLCHTHTICPLCVLLPNLAFFDASRADARFVMSLSNVPSLPPLLNA